MEVSFYFHFRDSLGVKWKPLRKHWHSVAIFMLYFTPTADTFWENFDLPDATFSLIRHSSGSRVNTLGNVDIRLIYQGVFFSSYAHARHSLGVRWKLWGNSDFRTPHFFLPIRHSLVSRLNTFGKRWHAPALSSPPPVVSQRRRDVQILTHDTILWKRRGHESDTHDHHVSVSSTPPREPHAATPRHPAQIHEIAAGNSEGKHTK